MPWAVELFCRETSTKPQRAASQRLFHIQKEYNMYMILVSYGTSSILPNLYGSFPDKDTARLAIPEFLELSGGTFAKMHGGRRITAQIVTPADPKFLRQYLGSTQK